MHQRPILPTGINSTNENQRLMIMTMIKIFFFFSSIVVVPERREVVVGQDSGQLSLVKIFS